VYVGLLDDGSLIYVVGTPDEMTGGVLLDATYVGREVSSEEAVFGVE
jgi:hypothetical protein